MLRGKKSKTKEELQTLESFFGNKNRRNKKEGGSCASFEYYMKVRNTNNSNLI